MIENRPAVKKPDFKINHSINQIIQVFLNADCRYMLPGLIGLAKKHKLDPELLNPGQLIVFLNTRRNYIKLLACNGTVAPILACYRLPHGRVVDLSIIAEIPKAFRGHELDYDQALRAALQKKM